MAIVGFKDGLKSFSARKKFGLRAGGIPGPNACVFQQKVTSEGKLTSKMKYYTPINPQTVPQQANRSKFSNAVSGWQSLTFEQKENYNKKAVGKNMSGYNYYLQLFMLDKL